MFHKGFVYCPQSCHELEPVNSPCLTGGLSFPPPQSFPRCHTYISLYVLPCGLVGQVYVLKVSETKKQVPRKLHISPGSLRPFKKFFAFNFPLAVRNVNTMISLIGVFRSKEALKEIIPSSGQPGPSGPVEFLETQSMVWWPRLWAGSPWQEIGDISRLQLVFDKKKMWIPMLCKIEMSGLSLIFLLKYSVPGPSMCHFRVLELETKS